MNQVIAEWKSVKCYFCKFELLFLLSDRFTFWWARSENNWREQNSIHNAERFLDQPVASTWGNSEDESSYLFDKMDIALANHLEESTAQLNHQTSAMIKRMQRYKKYQPMISSSHLTSST